MILNPYVQWLDEQFVLQNALTFDFRPLALRKPEDYSERPPYHDLLPRMLEIIDETLSEIGDVFTVEAAVYFGTYDYDIQRKL
jgi:hypothetical protein